MKRPVPQHHTQILLILPDNCTVGEIRDMLQASNASCVLISPNGQAVSDAEIVAAIQGEGAAALIADAPQLARDLSADGVHLTTDNEQADAYRLARQCLGTDAIIGLHAGQSRHLAMVAGELGATYIAFDPIPPGGDVASGEPFDLITWWMELFEVPCVAWRVADPAMTRNLAQRGIDFVALDMSAPQTRQTLQSHAAAV